MYLHQIIIFQFGTRTQKTATTRLERLGVKIELFLSLKMYFKPLYDTLNTIIII